MMQAFAFNLRRDKFQDPRVRLAFNYAFDFEEMNKQIFFGQYKRIASYFEGTDLAASGLPQGRELEHPGDGARQGAGRGVHQALHQSGRRQSRDGARNLREAVRLLKEAGYEVRNDQARQRQDRRTVTVEFLRRDPMFERVFLFYKPSLERLGIDVTVRTVD